MFCISALVTAPLFNIVTGSDNVVGAPVSWGLGVENAEEVL